MRPVSYSDQHFMGYSMKLLTPNRKNLIYIPIPKNASCWAKYYLAQLRAIEYDYYNQRFDTNTDLALVILRDPIERWISGIAQVLTGFHPSHPMNVGNIDWDLITRSVFRNNHTQPQHEFIANLPHNRTVWFYCDSSLQDKFIHFLKQYNFNPTILPTEQDTENKFNVSKRTPSKIIRPGEPGGVIGGDWTMPPQQDIVDQIRQVLDQHPEYVERLKNLYREDYNLIDSVTYYDPR